MKQAWLSRHRAAAMAVLIALAAAAPQQGYGQSRHATQEKFVVFGPEGETIDQVRYLRQTWRHNNAITVVRIAGWPKCERSSENGTTYCWVRVRHEAFVSIEWLNGGPVESFVLHYWYKPEGSPVKMADGDRWLVFLAPTVQGSKAYSATVIMPPTAENIDAVRQAVFKIMNSRPED